MVRVRVSGVLLLLLLLSLHTSARRNVASAATPAETLLLKLLGGGRTQILQLSDRSANTANECTFGANSEAGTCTLLTECQAFQHLISDLRGNLEFFRSRICRMTVENVYLCCPPTATNVALRQPSLTPPSSSPGGVTGGRAPSTGHRPPGLPLQPPRLPFQPTQSGFDPQPTQPSNNFPDRPRQPSASPSLITRPVSRPSGETDGVVGTQGPTGDREPGVLNTPDPTVLPEVSFVIPPETECGTRNTASNPGYWPWLVSLGRLQGERFDPICSGALITSRHVVAAAHCLVETKLTTPTHVRLGGSNSARDLAIVDHVDAGYNNITYQNDIAIVRLSEVVVFNELVQPVCLPFRFEFDGFRYQNLDLVGLGPVITTGENRIRQVTQKNVNVLIGGLDKCRRNYQMYKSLVFDHSKMCGSGSSAGDCMSDKGAPVFFYDEGTTKKYFLVGLVSFGFGCTKPEEPGAYTRVGAHVQWLQQHLN